MAFSGRITAWQVEKAVRGLRQTTFRPIGKGTKAARIVGNRTQSRTRGKVLEDDKREAANYYGCEWRGCPADSRMTERG